MAIVRALSSILGKSMMKDELVGKKFGGSGLGKIILKGQIEIVLGYRLIRSSVCHCSASRPCMW